MIRTLCGRCAIGSERWSREDRRTQGVRQRTARRVPRAAYASHLATWRSWSIHPSHEGILLGLRSFVSIVELLTAVSLTLTEKARDAMRPATKSDLSRRLGHAAALGMTTAMLVGTLMLTIGVSPAVAASRYVVNTTADGTGLGACKTGGSCALRQAIDQYNADISGADVIAFSVSTPATFNISADGTLFIDNTHGVPLTITGAGVTNTFIDGGGSVEVLFIEGNGAVTITGVTIQHGTNADYGPGIFIATGETLILNSVDISHNTAVKPTPTSAEPAGAGIFNTGTLTLNNSTVSANTATASGGAGGGIYTLSGTLTLNNSTVSGNAVTGTTGGGGGGGIFNYFSTVVLNNSNVSANTAADGGGVFNWGGSLTSQGSIISNNNATTLGGGGMQVLSGTVNLQSTTLNLNTASSADGGGVLNEGNLTLTSATVTGNAAADGGGIYNSSGTLTANNSIVTGNRASDHGGGLYEAGGTISLTATSVVGNTPDNIYPPCAGCDLSGDNLSGDNLSGLNLTNTNLSGANLTGANLSDANLTGANLTGANLTGANLSGANLTDANLTGANLSHNASLAEANLSGANLSGANLSGAYLINVNFWGAILSGANFSTQCNSTPSPNKYNTSNGGITSYLDLSLGDATPNFWNVSSSAGSVQQCYNPAIGLTDNIDVSSFQALGAGPDGFAEAGYGYSSYDGKYCSGDQFPCPVAPFPIPASSFTSGSQYLTTLTYNLGTISPSQSVDLTYDLWLEQNLTSAGPQPGDVEILITPYSSYPSCGTQDPSFTDSQGYLWNVYQGCGASNATALHFLLASPTQSTSRTITVNLTDFVREAESLLPSDPVSSEQMAGIEVGTEFGNNTCGLLGCGGVSSAQWTWTISRLNLKTPSAAVALIP